MQELLVLLLYQFFLQSAISCYAGKAVCVIRRPVNLDFNGAPSLRIRAVNLTEDSLLFAILIPHPFLNLVKLFVKPYIGIVYHFGIFINSIFVVPHFGRFQIVPQFSESFLSKVR